MFQVPTIIYEDSEMILLEKPSGMTVNKADTTKDEITLQDWINKNFQFLVNLRDQAPRAIDLEQKNINGEYNPKYEFFSRGGIVHRLDKETSGIILVAKNVESFVGLQRQFKERTIQKSYTALAHGKIVPSEASISVPLGRLPFNRKRFGVVAGGREAVTEYKILRYYDTKILRDEQLTLVELYAKTGRTHQIRVHLKYINHPIVADELYAGRKTARDDRKTLSRLFLHASSIKFIHPKTSKEMHMNSRLPDDLQNFLHTLEVK